MKAKTYRARSMQEALELIRRDLGPDAAVLHTQQVRRGMFPWLLGSRLIEVTASNNVQVPSRFGEPVASATAAQTAPPQSSQHSASSISEVPPAHEQDYRTKFRDDLKDQLSDLHSMMEELCQQNDRKQSQELPQTLFQLFTDLIDAEVSEELARELVDRIRSGASPGDLQDSMLLKARIARMVEEEIDVQIPITITPGQQRLVALVGPTGVGKTTTIAKLAANFRLRDKHRVGLITVDTYRIAAVEQLRTYADIIDLPMEVVATPREMRKAIDRFSDMDIVLMDTAGRSPHDECKIQELKSMLAEANADEVHLVLSSVSSLSSLKKAAKLFADVGVTSLLLTKLDEASGLGDLLPLLRSSRLPISYVTNGQNVPDDIEPANCRKLARIVLGMAS